MSSPHGHHSQHQPSTAETIASHFRSFCSSTPLVTLLLFLFILPVFSVITFILSALSIIELPIFQFPDNPPQSFFSFISFFFFPLQSISSFQLLVLTFIFYQLGWKVEMKFGSAFFAVLLSTIHTLTALIFLVYSSVYGSQQAYVPEWLRSVLSPSALWNSLPLLCGVIAAENRLCYDPTRRLFLFSSNTLIGRTVWLFPVWMTAVISIFFQWSIANWIAMLVGYFVGSFHSWVFSGRVLRFLDVRLSGNYFGREYLRCISLSDSGKHPYFYPVGWLDEYRMRYDAYSHKQWWLNDPDNTTTSTNTTGHNSNSSTASANSSVDPFNRNSAFTSSSLSSSSSSSNASSTSFSGGAAISVSNSGRREPQSPSSANELTAMLHSMSQSEGDIDEEDQSFEHIS